MSRAGTNLRAVVAFVAAAAAAGTPHSLRSSTPSTAPELCVRWRSLYKLALLVPVRPGGCQWRGHWCEVMASGPHCWQVGRLRHPRHPWHPPHAGQAHGHAARVRVGHGPHGRSHPARSCASPAHSASALAPQAPAMSQPVEQAQVLTAAPGQHQQGHGQRTCTCEEARARTVCRRKGGLCQGAGGAAAGALLPASARAGGGQAS